MTETENVPAPRRDGDSGGAAGPADGDAATGDALDLLTVAEVAAMLRLSKMTIYRLMDRGALPALRVGRSFRIPRDSVRALLEGTAQQT